MQAGSWLESLSFVAAHELKAPLALIRQLALELEAGNYTDVERAVLSQRIILTAERALRLTTDLTKARRLEDALFTLEPVDATSVCSEAVDELQPLYCAHGKRLEIRSKSRRSLTIANRDLLRRIMLIMLFIIALAVRRWRYRCRCLMATSEYGSVCATLGRRFRRALGGC